MDAAAFYTRTTLSPEEAREQDRVLGALAAATRALADAQLRTQVSLEEAAEATAEIEAITDRLLRQAKEGSLGAELGPGEGEIRNPGNAVTGLRNPFASIHAGRKWADDQLHLHAAFHLGAMYEGPPGFVHGGVSALVLDQMLGEAAAVGGGPGMTGRLSLSYRRPTPLGELTSEAWTEKHDGRKTTTRGVIRDPDGNVTVEAEGLFILPRWAAEHPGWQSRANSFE
jgi:acyl-coenzyme A thioesterase PaaI-like protein